MTPRASKTKAATRGKKRPPSPARPASAAARKAPAKAAPAAKIAPAAKAGAAAKSAPAAGSPRLRADEIYKRLQKLYPDAHCALEHADAFQLIIATILSAQCTDDRVNMVTPILFARFPTPQAMAQADIAELEQIVRSTGFYRNKAKSIKECARGITERFGGQVPRTMDELLSLRGVARKTANVVLGNAYGINEGIVVDTHVGRLSHRMGLTKHGDKEAVKIEQDLIKLFDRDRWTMLAHLLIFHGRQVCAARKPACDRCPLSDICPRAGL